MVGGAAKYGWATAANVCPLHPIPLVGVKFEYFALTLLVLSSLILQEH